MKRYELLQEGDVIKEGDEYLDTNGLRWIKVNKCIGNKYMEDLEIIRRRVDKPKVRLEELNNVALKAYSNVDHETVGQGMNAAVKAICAHLGIELEEEKPAWQKAYENYLAEGPIHQTYEETAQAMFEAGQHPEVEIEVRNARKALKEASAPMKEFAGLNARGWRNIELLLQMHGELNKEAAACRQIAEGLHE